MANPCGGDVQLNRLGGGHLRRPGRRLQLTRARIDQDFSGGIAAAGRSQNLMFYRADGTAAFVGCSR